MQCQECGDRDAVVHLTQIVENNVTTTHLCEQCAATKGIESNTMATATPLGDFLATLNKGVGAGLPEVENAPHTTCPTCGLTTQEFHDVGRLGCGDCYQTFETPLRELLRRLHGSTTHAGERYRPPGADPSAPAEEAAELRDRLRVAVEAEHFELAAEIRDRLRGLT